jgi:8-oxo-dGTP pyrophosphatase MutT (NUDIX family)
MPTIKSNNAPSTHAGGVVYRLLDSKHELLVVTTRIDRSVWVLPKGHIEPGESPDATAVREVYEEAGVRARIVEFLTTSRQVIRGVPQQVEYFLLERVAEEKASEGRGIAWLPEDSVLRRITHDVQRAVLKQACARLAEGRDIP